MFQILKQYFGYDQFRPGQEDLIQSTLAGQDVLGIMPTGGGKSLCFQVPALMMSGITLVISPLISLMQDQVGALLQAGIGAAYINSTLTPKQMDMALYNGRQGQYRLIYVAPERLMTPSFLAFAQSVPIAMVTVDEAHCISQWGQDFRPSYCQIPEFLSQLPRRPVVTAYTATATQRVRDDIVQQLELHNPHILVTGFNRDNLHFAVEHPRNKPFALCNFLEKHPGESGIVYCSTRKNVEKISQLLQDEGYNVAPYHAGLSDKTRHQNQDDFLFDRTKIIVATNAFGMGIDKSNVSFVVHYNMPKDMESYYQEAGRGGRDGNPAQCLLLYSGQDVITAKFLIENGHDTDNLPPEQAEQLRTQAYARLQQMEKYAKTSSCLRRYILGYFGEKAGNFCDNCSNCSADVVREDVTITAQKILSCIYRMGQRFGKKMVIDVLRGSKNNRLLSLQFDQLSTYNICQETEARLYDVIDYLVEIGHLQQTQEQYPVLQLTESAKNVLKGQEKVEIRQLRTPEPTSAKPDKKKKINELSVGQLPLYDSLKKLRSQLALAQKVPAYVVFSDRTLTDMCNKLPKNLKEFLQVSGVGQQKMERYGQDFLDAIAPFLENT